MNKENVKENYFKINYHSRLIQKMHLKADLLPISFTLKKFTDKHFTKPNKFDKKKLKKEQKISIRCVRVKKQIDSKNFSSLRSGCPCSHNEKTSNIALVVSFYKYELIFSNYPRQPTQSYLFYNFDKANQVLLFRDKRNENNL